MAGSPSDVTWETKKILIIGRASPEPSKKHVETVCTGGITENGELLRLYPIPYRQLQAEQQYKLWTWASFEVCKDTRDKRKESHKVREGSIRVLSQVKQKAEQFSLLSGGIAPSLEELRRKYKLDWTSLGIIEIEFLEFSAKLQSKSWEKDKPHIRQFHLFAKVRPLEPLPVEMRLRFRCKGSAECKTHDCMLLGWEYMAAFRRFRQDYGGSEQALERISAMMIDRFSDQTKRPLALVGTHFKHPSWMVAQLYWFDKNLNRRLF